MTIDNFDKLFADISNRDMSAIPPLSICAGGASTLETPLPADPIIDARKVLYTVLRTQPELMLEGFKTPLNAHLWPSSRSAMLRDDVHINAFVDARMWLRDRQKQKTFNRTGTSYGWKHVAEREMETYIPNGLFIAAAIEEGFCIQRERGTPNVFLNIARKKS